MDGLKILVGGDVMLGRNVGHWIRKAGPSYPLGEISGIMKQGDIVMVNLECSLTSSKALWKGERKAFYFGAPGDAIHALKGVDVVSLANNHVLDFDIRGLYDTLDLLDEAGIVHAGAGRNGLEASRAVFFERKGIRFGMVAYCDHQEDFSAGPDKPGINYIDLSEEEAALSRFRADLKKMDAADWPILSLHWGPNMVFSPSAQFVRLAHAAIEMGYAMIYGHSAHVFHGVELYKGRPILYSCGDLVDDYYVDPRFENDHQLLFELHLSGKRLDGIRIHPVFIEDCRTIPAEGERRKKIVERFALLCSAMGTEVMIDSSGQAEILC